MIVGLNLLYMLPGIVGGTETYAAGLVHGLSLTDEDAEFLIYLNRESADWPLPSDPRFRRVVCPVQATSRLARYWHEQRRLPTRVALDGVDLLHSLGYVAPLRLSCPSVLTVPDVHQLAYGRPAEWPRRLVVGEFVRRSVRSAAAVITISQFARAAVAQAYGLRVEAINVVLLAPKPRMHRVGPPVASSSVRLPKSYVVAFGSVTPNKNLPRLLDAFEMARTRFGLRHDLVLVGRLPGELRTAGRPGIVVTGYLEDEAVAIVLAGAEALVFPSIYEGFGLPVLEAMAAGVPVVCSNATAVPEVAGEAAVYFDPLDAGDMAAALARVCADPLLRADLRARGCARAATFGWERVAHETLAIYRRVLGGEAAAAR